MDLDSSRSFQLVCVTVRCDWRLLQKMPHKHLLTESLAIYVLIACQHLQLLKLFASHASPTLMYTERYNMLETPVWAVAPSPTRNADLTTACFFKNLFLPIKKKSYAVFFCCFCSNATQPHAAHKYNVYRKAEFSPLTNGRKSVDVSVNRSAHSCQIFFFFSWMWKICFICGSVNIPKDLRFQ